MSPETFNRYMLMISEYCGQSWTPTVSAMYWDCLRHLTDEEFQRAVKGVIAEWKPTNAARLPLVADFLRLCGKSTSDMGRAAIMAIRAASARVGQNESVTFCDEALHSAIEGFGGWPSVATWTAEEWDVNEGRLYESYCAAVRSGARGMSHLPGVAEKDAGVYRLYWFSPKRSKIVKELKFRGPADEALIQQTTKALLMHNSANKEIAHDRQTA